MATALAREIETAPNLRLVQVWTRGGANDPKPAVERLDNDFVSPLCSRTEANATSPALGGETRVCEQTLKTADIYIIAVTDDAIGEVSRRFEFPADSVVAHTAGGVEMDAMSPEIAHRAVLYPLQSFTRGRTVHDFRSRVPFLVEGATAHALQTVRAVAAALSDSVTEMDSEARAQMHLAAVFASNFANAMWSAAEILSQFCGEAEKFRGAKAPLAPPPGRDGRALASVRGGAVQNIEKYAYPPRTPDCTSTFDLLRPLISEIAAKALEMPSPRDAQTGPAARGDVETQARHIEMLAHAGSEIAQNHPELAEIYKKISNFIWKTSRKN